MVLIYFNYFYSFFTYKGIVIGVAYVTLIYILQNIKEILHKRTSGNNKIDDFIQ